MRAEELFEQVTADLVAAIETGAGEWRMAGPGPGAGLPRRVGGGAERGGVEKAR